MSSGRQALNTLKGFCWLTGEDVRGWTFRRTQLHIRAMPVALEYFEVLKMPRDRQAEVEVLRQSGPFYFQARGASTRQVLSDPFPLEGLTSAR